MKRGITLFGFVLSAALFVLLPFDAPASAASFHEPIARAATGQMQCYSPNTANKTCAAIASFKADADGKIVTTAVILISPNPLIVMKGSASVATKSGELCGVLNARNIEDAIFSNGDGALDPTQATFLRKIIEVPLQDIFGHEICGSYVADGATLRAAPKLDGEPMSVKGQRVIWVAPADGYRVGP